MIELYKPYELVLLKSEVTTKLTFDETLVVKGYEFVFWHMSKVKYFRDADAAKEYYQNEKDYILNIRIFKEDEEYYFWRSGKQLIGRWRKDKVSPGGEVYAIETEMVLRNVIAPVKTDKTEGKFFLKTINYIANDGFGYNDSRFMEITFKK